MEQERNKSVGEETQVFIVRLWRELREIEGARPLLRGTVEHVQSGQRRSFLGLERLPYIIAEYVGIPVRSRPGCQRCLAHWRASIGRRLLRGRKRVQSKSEKEDSI
jgi:hypothetical protein